MSNPLVGERAARCTVCGARFVTGRRGPVASRCTGCQREWLREFHRRRPVQTKAERAAFYALKKAEGNLKNGKVLRGRPPTKKHRFGQESRAASDCHEQLRLMSLSDPFYRQKKTP
jgi:hypothetical protein